MQDGLQLDQSTLIEVLQNKLAQAAIREAQMEAAVFQLQGKVAELSLLVPTDTEVKEDASADA